MGNREIIKQCLDSVKFELHMMQIAKTKGKNDDWLYIYYQRANAKIDLMEDMHLIHHRHASALQHITERAFFRG